MGGGCKGSWGMIKDSFGGGAGGVVAAIEEEEEREEELDLSK